MAGVKALAQHKKVKGYQFGGLFDIFNPGEGGTDFPTPDPGGSDPGSIIIDPTAGLPPIGAGGGSSSGGGGGGGGGTASGGKSGSTQPKLPPSTTGSIINLLKTPGVAAGIALLGGLLTKPKTNNPGLQQQQQQAQQYAQNFVKIPTISSAPVYGPAPKPGVLRPMARAYDVTGYTHPAQGYYAQGGGISSLRGFLDGGSPGMDDDVPAHIDGVEPVALSDGEFIIPADVVAHLGDGNSKAGAARLHELIRQIRMAKTGKAKQPGKLKRSALPDDMGSMMASE